MVFSAVSQPEAITMRGWLSTFARFASQFDSDTLNENRLESKSCPCVCGLTSVTEDH